MSIPDVQRAIEMIENGRPADALEELQELVQRWPAYATAHVLLARAYEGLTRWDEALAAWQRAYFLMPNSPAVREGLERALETRLEPSTAHLEAAAELETDDAVSMARGDDATLSLVGAGWLPESERAAAEETGRAEPDFSETGEAVTEVSGDERGLLPEEGWITEPSVDEETFGAVEGDEGVAERVPVDASNAAEAPTGEDMVLAGEAGELDIDEAIYLEIERLIDEKLAEGEGAETVPEASAPAPPDFERDVSDETIVLPRPMPWAPPEGVDDLDRLIDELETARIVPRPDFESIPPPEMEDEIEDMVSETLARIYASQGQYDEAARVYEQLAIQQPEQSIAFLQKAAEMRARADGDEGG